MAEIESEKVPLESNLIVLHYRLTWVGTAFVTARRDYGMESRFAVFLELRHHAKPLLYK